jgi:ribonuclease-3
MEELKIPESGWALYIQALTHTSHAEEHGGEHNERLEFMGDAVLQLAASDLLWRRFPGAREGELSRMRRLVVNNRFLATLARERELGVLLRLGRGEARTGGRERESNLAGAYEAMLGAVYLSEGYEAVSSIVEAVIGPRLKELQGTTNPKQILHEWVQATHKETPSYQLVSTSGPDHDLRFTMAVTVNGAEIARGEGTSKRGATNAAAKQAAEALGLL